MERDAARILKTFFCAMSSVDPDMLDQAELAQLHDASERVAEPRQLGDWITVTVDAAKKIVQCDCDQCNRYGLCILSATMCVLHFNQNVPNHCKQVDEGFG